MDDETVLEHESFGQLSFHRIHAGTGKPLYGSALKHSEIIRMTLSKSKWVRSLHENRHYPKEILFEVDLSPQQFAEVITTMNMGGGIPVTIYRMMGKQLKECPHEDERALFTKEFQQRINKVTGSAQKLIERAQDLLSQKTPMKASEKGELKSLLSTIQLELQSNMKFAGDMFQETVEKTVSAGKQEIEAFWRGVVEHLGVANLSENARHHDIGERGCLKDSILVPLEDELLIFTEKIDGCNARIILFPDKEYFIGSREDLLTASGDIIYNPSLGIVDVIRPLVPQISKAFQEMFSVYVLFGEVYGAKVGSNGKNYTEKGQAGFRLFDIVSFTSERDLETFLEEKSIEKISSWRDHGGQTFLNEIDLQSIAHNSGIPLTPRIMVKGNPPQGVKETLEWLKLALPGNTNASIDGPGGKPEGIVARTLDRAKIVKLRFEDYERTLRQRRGG